MRNKEIKLNLGCASRLLEGYINVDMDSLEQLEKRYPTVDMTASRKLKFLQADVLDLPLPAESVDEIRADALVEHLSFLEESRFFYEMKRLLKPGGILKFAVPDFEDLARKWLDAQDEWKDFFRNDEEAIKQEHWFGQYSYSADNRWGYLMAGIFGPQNGEGQFHKNAYTESKIRAICKKIDFHDPHIDRFLWKGERELMIRVEVVKK